MRKLFYILLSVIVLNSFFLTNVVAQNPQLNERWACLIGKRCDVVGANCQGVGSTGYQDVHRARLTTDPNLKPNPGTTYILECLGTSKGLCTTGNAAVDAEVFNTSITDPELPFNKATATIGYKFEGMYKADGKTTEVNPINNPTSDIEPIEWQSSSVDMARKYMTLNFVDLTQAVTGQENTLQLGTNDWETANRVCEIVRWDPYGVVFNSLTLEPVYNALVYLDYKDTKGNWVQYEDPMGKVKNPYRSELGVGTADDGHFSFVVEDGTYRLRVVPPSTTLSFPYDNKRLSSNYKKIYSDIYPGMLVGGTSPTFIYEIKQSGKIQHRDIPLISQTKTLSERKIREMEVFRNRLNNGKELFKVRLSYPFAKISGVYSTINDPPVRYKQIPFGKGVAGDQSADKDGWFSIEVDVSKFTAGEMFGEIDATKVDLTDSTLVKKQERNVNFFALVKQEIKKLMNNKIIAQVKDTNTSTFSFDPIPSYLEGYAYDNNGTVVSNATVGIYLSFSNRPYSQIKTDATGYYRFSSETLPSMPYDIRYTTAIGNTVKTTPRKFITQNKEYFIKQKINPFIAQNQSGQTIKINPTETSSESGGLLTTSPNLRIAGKISGDNKSNKTQSGFLSNNIEQNNNQVVTVIVMLLILILVVGIILTIYLIKKKQTQQPLV